MSRGRWISSSTTGFHSAQRRAMTFQNVRDALRGDLQGQSIQPVAACAITGLQACEPDESGSVSAASSTTNTQSPSPGELNCLGPSVATVSPGFTIRGRGHRPSVTCRR